MVPHALIFDQANKMKDIIDTSQFVAHTILDTIGNILKFRPQMILESISTFLLLLVEKRRVLTLSSWTRLMILGSISAFLLLLVKKK
jgi:hypothetical protein